MPYIYTLTEGRFSDREDNELTREMLVDETTPLIPSHHGSDSDTDHSPPTPPFIQDEYRYKGWKKMPSRLRRVGAAITRWTRGPKPPRIQRIKPSFPTIQEAPLWLLDTYLPKKRERILLLVAFYICWIISFSLVLRESTKASEIEGLGEPVQISCVASYWSSRNLCGLNGNDCRPFNGSGFAFKCPANCGETMVLNPHAVGAQEINYRPLVVGGPVAASSSDKSTYYRGDSFICGSAIHAGIIDDAMGGCGAVQLVGQQVEFISSQRNGIKSIPFDSYFPRSFAFESQTSCKAKDLRWSLLAISLNFTVIFSLFVSSSALFFFTMFVSMFAHVGLASDPPYHDTMVSLISNVLGKFLPAMFCAFVMYRFMGIRRTLNGLTAQIEKTILWLGGCWVGALNNYTFGHIPIERLTAHDLKTQPGAIPALAIVVSVLACIVIQQVYYFQLEGRFPSYIKLYALFVGTILLSLTIPGLNLRIHHYVLALLFLPGTSIQTRPALLYQGILVGLFINGIARWGFDPVLQTTEDLRQDGPWNSLLPSIYEPLIQLATTSTLPFATSNITFTWPPVPAPFDGMSVLVNDVERYRGYVDEGGIGGLWSSSTNYDTNNGPNVIGKDPYGGPATNRFFWERKADLDLPEYFRFGFLEGSRAWDYTKAGIWTSEGEWVWMEVGPSGLAGDGGEPELHLGVSRGAEGPRDGTGNGEEEGGYFGLLRALDRATRKQGKGKGKTWKVLSDFFCWWK